MSTIQCRALLMRNTVKAIRDAVRTGRLKSQFRGTDINVLLGITWGGNFLAKHCVGNGYTTEHFVRVSRGRYRLK
jgi:hypothetical protein